MTKYDVLELLRSESGYLSGESISGSFGVSRAAVNAAVKSLREEGYTIASSTGRGYKFESAPDVMTPAELSHFLPRGRGRVLCLKSADSTNNCLRAMAFDGAPNGQTVIADMQTSGRGRSGRSFVSPGGSGIYLSMLFRPTGAPADTVYLTAWTAVAVSRAIERVCGVRPSIKWVNDLVIGDKKICGILTEMSVESETGGIQYVVIGIGVNANLPAGGFPDELRSIASSIQAETGRAVCRAHLAAEIICELDRMCLLWPSGAAQYLREYRDHCLTVGREVSVVSGDRTSHGTALSVNDDFSLKIMTDEGERNVQSGEVSVRGMYGYV